MIRKEEGGLHWLEFEQLAEMKGLLHRVYTSYGGCSQAPYASLNFSTKVGDDAKAVARNREIVEASLPIKRLIQAPICHSSAVLAVTSPTALVTAPCDGLATTLKGIALAVTHADCQGAIFYDPITPAVAAVHCGWKGNVLDIYGNTITFMKKTFASKPENILVGISPSLGPNSAEFINYKQELPKDFWKHQISPYFFDLWAVSKEQLLNAGVMADHIEIAEIDTFTSLDFFSHRRERPTGRNATLAVLM